MCRNYHHHIVDIVDRLISGVTSKGPHTAVNIADIAQVWHFPSSILLPASMDDAHCRDIQSTCLPTASVGIGFHLRSCGLCSARPELIS